MDKVRQVQQGLEVERALLHQAETALRAHGQLTQPPALVQHTQSDASKGRKHSRCPICREQLEMLLLPDCHVLVFS